MFPFNCIDRATPAQRVRWRTELFYSPAGTILFRNFPMLSSSPGHAVIDKGDDAGLVDRHERTRESQARCEI